jgi:hypothetical protein
MAWASLSAFLLVQLIHRGLLHGVVPLILTFPFLAPIETIFSYPDFIQYDIVSWVPSLVSSDCNWNSLVQLGLGWRFTHSTTECDELFTLSLSRSSYWLQTSSVGLQDWHVSELFIYGRAGMAAGSKSGCCKVFSHTWQPYRSALKSNC